MLTQSLLGMLVVSAATAFLFPPPAMLAADPPADPEIKRLLEKIDTSVTGVRNDIASVNDKIKSLDQQITAIQSSMVTTTEHERLRAQLERLKVDVDQLRTQLQNQIVTARSAPPPNGSTIPPPGGMAPARPAPLGVLRVTNNNFVPMEVLVNGVTYQVPAYSVYDVSVPAGAFTYRVLDWTMATSRTTVMPAGRVFGISINP